MNLGFKRITSSILAFVMMFSTLVVANVAGVSAASTDFYLTADDLNSGLTIGSSQKNIVLSEKATNAGLTVSTDGSGYYHEYGARAQAQGKVDPTNNTGKEFTTEYRAGGSRTLSFTPASNGKLNVYVYTDKTDRTLTIGGISNTVSGSEPYVVKIVSQDVTANQEVTITTSTNIVILAIEYVSSSATYSWELNTNSLSSVPAGNVSIDTSAAGATNTLSYSGTDYVVKEANKNLAEGSEGVVFDSTTNTFTVTPTDDMFLPVTENISISVENAAGRTLRMVGANNGYTYNINLDESGNASGIALVQDTYTMAITGGTLSFTNVTVDSSTAVINPVFTSNEAVTFAAKVNISDLGTKTITEESYLDSDNLFKVLPKLTGSNDVAINANSRSVTLADGTTFISTNRLTTQGIGDTTERAVSFKTGDVEGGKVYVYALSGNSSDVRILYLSDGTTVQEASVAVSGSDSSTEASECVFDVSGNTTYYLYGSNSISIYYIGSTAELTAFTDGGTIEPPAGDYVVAGSYDFNLSAMGYESDANVKSGTYANMEWSSGNKLTTDHLKLKNKNTDYIKFTIAEPLNLTATFTEGNGLTINREGLASPVTLRSGIAVMLRANVEYTITGAGSSNTRLTNLTFEETEDKGHISGTVNFVDSEGSTPVSDAEVYYVKADDPTVEGIASTDSTGKFTTLGLDDGTYNLSVEESDTYYTGTATATITNGADTTVNIELNAKDTTEYDVTFNITNSATSGNSIIIRSAVTGTIVNSTDLVWDELSGVTATISLPEGKYYVELLDKTLGSITFTDGRTNPIEIKGDGESVSIEVIALKAEEELTPVPAGTYNFGTSGISTSTENFYLLRTTAEGDSVNLDRTAHIYFVLDTAMNVKISTTGKNTTLTSADGHSFEYTVVSGADSEFVLQAGLYVLNGASGAGVNVKSMTFTVADTATHIVTLNVTNNKAVAIDIAVRNSAGEAVAEFTGVPVGSSTYTCELSNDTYTVTSSSSGTEITGDEEFTVSGADMTVDITAETSTDLNFTVTLIGNSKTVTININGTDYKFPASTTATGNTITITGITRGDVVTYKFSDDVASKIVDWQGGFDPDSYDKTKKTFKSNTQLFGDVFTYNEDAMTTTDGEDYGTSTEKLAFGNYGYGATKGNAGNATQAETVAALNAVGGQVTLRDFAAGYRTADARLILNNNSSTGVKFTAADEGTLIIDVSNGTPVVTVKGSAVTGTAVGSSGKLSFTLKANDEVVISSGSTKLKKSLHLKSVRYQSDGNIVNVTGVETVAYDSLTDDTKALMNDVDTSKVFARIVAAIDTNNVEADTITGTGVLIISKANVDAELYEEDGADVYMPANHVATGEAGVIDLYETEMLYDGVYDGTTPAENGKYAHDSSVNSEYSDGIYYLLRHINVDAGEYYVLPYTVFGNSEPVFSMPFIDNSNVADINSKYLVNLQ